ncbi:hypothetical protein FACS1894162_4440 [Bacteroidia bacterium]|nr:hypothetical protein FACS1894162_4440 [Bacteroidia bacterium]
MLSAQFAGGSGTLASPFIILTPQHLDNMYSADYGSDPANPVARYFELGADLDMTGFNWVPTNSESPYNRVIHFNGNGHVIKNLTCEGQPYASLFGVLCGSCRNLGLVNVNIVSTSAAGGIGGYIGSKTPTVAWSTGVVDNCYVTGKIDGQVAAGGIAGNIGKPSTDNQTISAIRNCYSTADVTVSNAGEGRSGGIVGIIWNRGYIENCYATGIIRCHSATGRSGAGGVAGWSDSNLIGCVALNDSVINYGDPTQVAARLAAYIGSGVAEDGSSFVPTAIKCAAYEGTVCYNYNYTVSPAEMKTTIERNLPFDGEAKTAAFYNDPLNWFMDFDYDMASAEPIWSQTLHNSRPIFSWLADRNDYEQIDGHHQSANTGIKEMLVNDFRVVADNGTVSLTSKASVIDAVKIYSFTGQLLHSAGYHSNSINIPFEQEGLFIISVLNNETWQSQKLVLK